VEVPDRHLVVATTSTVETHPLDETTSLLNDRGWP
jgi:hypothetical protein